MQGQRHCRAQELKALKEKYKKLGKKHKDEGAKEEAALEAIHAVQLAALHNRDEQREAVQHVSDGLYGVALGPGDGAQGTRGGGEKKLTKAQRQREKRAQRDAEREARIEAEKAAMPESERLAEERALRNALKPLGLMVHEIKVWCVCV